MTARISHEERGYKTPCWIWQQCLTAGGYGAVRVDGMTLRAHRWYYERLVGPVAAGLVLHHLCEVLACVNPDHLEPLTCAEHSARHAAATTHCIHGHEYTEENTYYRKDGRGKRGCRTCRARDMKNFYARKRHG